jgi:zinc-ribbon domain
MFCPFCGSQNRDDKKFCRQCGHKLPPPKHISTPPSMVAESPLPELGSVRQPADGEIVEVPVASTPPSNNFSNNNRALNSNLPDNSMMAEIPAKAPTRLPVEAWAEALEDTVAPEQWLGNQAHSQRRARQTGEIPLDQGETAEVAPILETDRPTAKLPPLATIEDSGNLVSTKLASSQAPVLPNAATSEAPMISTPYKVLRKKKKLRDSISMSINSLRERVNDTGISLTDTIVRNRKSSQKEERRGFVWFGIMLLAIILMLLALNSAIGSGLVQYLESLYLDLLRPER